MVKRPSEKRWQASGGAISISLPSSRWYLPLPPTHVPNYERIVAMTKLPPPPLDSRTLNRLLIVACGLAFAGFGAFSLDLPVASFASRGELPGEVQQILQLSEVFAHGWGAFFILLTVWILDPERRRVMPRLLGTVLFPVLATHLGKLLVVRARPRTFGVEGVLQLPSSVWDTFQASTWDLRVMAESDLQSWPSGHTATAVGLAVGLTWLYPRGRWLFAVLATMSALQRVAVSAHFLSDTCFAAALSLCAVQICYRNNRLTRWYSRLEHGNPAATTSTDSAPAGTT